MLHLGTVVTRLPPPILNLKPTDGGVKETNNTFRDVLVGVFEQYGVDYKRQNSIEDDKTALAIANAKYQTTDIFPKKLATDTPMRDGYIQAKEMELKKNYYDSFNNDLIELQGFTISFTKSIMSLTSIIQAMDAIPSK